MAKADHADTCEQVPVRRKDEYAAVATARDPGAEELYGFFSKTSQFGSASADLRCNCFSRSVDSLVRGSPKLSHFGHDADFGGKIRLEIVSKTAGNPNYAWYRISGRRNLLT